MCLCHSAQFLPFLHSDHNLEFNTTLMCGSLPFVRISIALAGVLWSEIGQERQLTQTRLHLQLVFEFHVNRALFVQLYSQSPLWRVK